MLTVERNYVSWRLHHPIFGWPYPPLPDGRATYSEGFLAAVGTKWIENKLIRLDNDVKTQARAEPVSVVRVACEILQA